MRSRLMKTKPEEASSWGIVVFSAASLAAVSLFVAMSLHVCACEFVSVLAFMCMCIYLCAYTPIVTA